MARVIGAPGCTSMYVRAARLLRDPASWLRLLPTVGSSAAVLTWGIGSLGALQPAIASSVLAVVGLLWMSATSTVSARRAGARLRGAVEVVAAVADMSIAAGLGGLAGVLIAQPGDTVLHAAADLGGGIGLCLSAWRQIRVTRARAAQLRAGVLGEQEVAAALTVLPEAFTVFHNVLVPSARGVCEADHVVLGPTGIFVLETKRWAGVLTTGTATWRQDSAHRRRIFPSPVRRLREVQRAVAARFGVPSGCVTPVLVLIRGTVSGDPGVQIRRPDELARAIVRASSRWPLAISVQEASTRLIWRRERGDAASRFL